MCQEFYCSDPEPENELDPEVPGWPLVLGLTLSFIWIAALGTALGFFIRWVVAR